MSPESTALRELKLAVRHLQQMPPDAVVRVHDIAPTVKRSLEHSEKVEQDATSRAARIETIATKLVAVIAFIAALTLIVVVATAIVVSRTGETTEKLEQQQSDARVTAFNGRVFACTERERLKLAIRLVAPGPIPPPARGLLAPYDPRATTLPGIDAVCQQHARESTELRR